MTQDLAILVDQQGASINEMEKNVDSAKKNVEDGIEHLEVVRNQRDVLARAAVFWVPG